MSASGKFRRAPRVATPGRPSDALKLVRRLTLDPRFRALRSKEREALLYAALHFADGVGFFWWTRQKWAEAAGVSRATVGRAIAAAQATKPPLLTVEPYLRPDAVFGMRQGASGYRFDSALMGATRWLTDEPLDKVAQNEPVTRRLTSDPPERANGKPEREKALLPDAAIASSGERDPLGRLADEIEDGSLDSESEIVWRKTYGSKLNDDDFEAVLAALIRNRERGTIEKTEAQWVSGALFYRDYASPAPEAAA